MITLKSKTEQVLRWILFLFWLCMVIFLVSRHENWRDEAQAWLMVRDLNFTQLIRQMRYEGHPCLWHLILMPFAKLGFPYRISNMVSLVLVVSAAVLLLWKSPIPLAWQVPVLFGSAFIYFMPVITRSYALVPLFVFINAMLYRERTHCPKAYGLSLALLVQVHVYLLPFAGFLSLAWLAEALAAYRRDHDGRELLRQGVGLLLPFISLLLFLAQISGVKQSSAYRIEWQNVFNIRKLFNHINIELFGLNHSKIYGAIPAFLLERPRATFLLILFVLFVPTVVLFLSAAKKRNVEVVKAAGIYLFTTFSILFLSLLLRRFSMQKTAILAFLPIWLLWVLWPDMQDTRSLKRLALIAYAGVSLFFLILDSKPITDINGCYSDSPNCAAFIRENLPDDAVIFQDKTPFASSVVAYLDADGFYSMESGELESFAKWVDQQPTITDYETFCKVARRANPSAERAYWLIPMDVNRPFALPWDVIANYADILEHTEEDYLLYSTFLEIDHPPNECYTLIQIPIRSDEFISTENEE